MKILYLKNSDVNHADVRAVMQKRGHQLIEVDIADAEEEVLKKINRKDCEIISALNEKNIDMVFSLAYVPCISVLCSYYSVFYVSWNMEPPFSDLFSSTVINKCNLIFVADKQLVSELQREGIENVFYLPPGVNIERMEHICENHIDAEKKYPISYVGQINEESWSDLFQTDGLKDATLGYLDGILVSQNLVYGMDFWNGRMPQYVIEDLMQHSPLQMRPDSVEPLLQYYAEHCFYKKTTMLDRTRVINALANAGEVHVFAPEYDFQNENVVCHDDEGEFLEIVNKTIINLNISPRGFRDGLYERLLKIMAMGGFVISDYRPELEQEFEMGKDLVIYEDMIDLVKKVLYYKEHTEEREKIRISGMKKVHKMHSLDLRIQEMENRVKSEAENRQK